METQTLESHDRMTNLNGSHVYYGNLVYGNVGLACMGSEGYDIVFRVTSRVLGISFMWNHRNTIGQAWRNKTR